MHQLAERDPIPSTNFDRRQRTEVDTISWCAEVLNGSMRTPHFEYRFDGSDLYGQDGGSLKMIFDNAIEAAQIIAREQPGLLFELRRRLIERSELDRMLEMAQGTAPNTLVVVSDFPPELNQDISGYNSARKQTMLRVITKQPDGTIRVITQSLDGSNRQALEAIYAFFGCRPKPGELLGQWISLDLPCSEQAGVVDIAMNIYDDSLRFQNGGDWHAGISKSLNQNRKNTFDFATRQNDLINWFVDQKLHDSIEAEKLRYKLAAAMTARFEQSHEQIPTVETPFIRYLGLAAGLTAQQLVHEIEFATRCAKLSGRPFNGCGITESGGPSSHSEMDQLGYGAVYEDQYGSLTFDCPKGHRNTRERGKLIPKCQKCGVSVRC